MKKLFTLFAFLAIVLGAKAETITDQVVDYSTATEIKFYGWGASESARARLSLQDGCLHFHSDVATEPAWDCQFYLAGGFDIDEGVTYTVTVTIKGTVAQGMNAHFAGVDGWGWLQVPTDWQDVAINYTATKAGDFMIQCGDYVGDWDIKKIVITHEQTKPQKEIKWQTMEGFVNGDAEGEYGDVPCMISRVYQAGGDIPTEIVDLGGNKAFKITTAPVDPPMRWESDGTNDWGQEHKAGDLMPDNVWQNQMFIQFPKALKEGEQYQLRFKYKASEAAKVSTQTHKAPGSYLGGGFGDLNFTDQWQEAVFNKQTAAEGLQSIAFNLGEDDNYSKEITFYIDDIVLEEVVVDHGWFVAGANTKTGIPDYDFDNAIQFEDMGDNMFMGMIGGEDQDTWVNEIMISTVRGTDKAFKANTIKLQDPIVNDRGEGETWNTISGTGNAVKLRLPAAGCWAMMLNTEFKQISFTKVYGEEDREPIEIKPNPTEVVVNAVEREKSVDEAKAEGLIADPANPTQEEKAIYSGQPWDNQFFLIGNRSLAVGENVVVSFKYKADKEATVGTQCSKDAGGYLHYAALGDFNFTTEWQEFEKVFTVPSETKGEMNSFTFNLSIMKEANNYYFKDIIFKTEDNFESLIDMEGTTSLWVKEGANTAAFEFGHKPEPDGIESVVSKAKVATVTYNLAGQRVSNGFKGIVIKNGQKFVK